jgi:anti-sigma B factor antagonist
MEIVKSIANGTLIVNIIGRVDTNTSPALDKELKASFDSINALILDFSQVEYISSAGLRVLLSAHKAMISKGGMKILNVSDDIMEIFEVTGFSDILEIE